MNILHLTLALLSLSAPQGRPESYLGLHTALPAFADEAELEDPDLAPGLSVVAVVENSPAMQAGLQIGDRLLRLDDRAPRTPQHLDSMVAGLPVGEKITLTVRRADSLIEVRPTTVLRLVPREAPKPAYFLEARRLGLALATLETSESLRRGLSPGDGIRVERLLEGSPLRSSGLEPGDIILDIGKERIHGQDDFLAVTQALEPGAELELHIQREGRTLPLRVTTLRPEGYVSKFSIPLIVSYEEDPKKEETTFGVLLDIFKYKKKEAKSTYRFFWILSFSLGTNEELEEVVP